MREYCSWCTDGLVFVVLMVRFVVVIGLALLGGDVDPVLFEILDAGSTLTLMWGVMVLARFL